MPRKKRMPGAHFEWDFVNGPRGRSMSPVEWTLYSKLWALATHDRRKIVCRMRYDCTYLSEFMHIDRRTLGKLLTQLEHKSCKNVHLHLLLEVTEHFIKVNGVQDKQPWLTWKEPLDCCSPDVPSRKTKDGRKTKDESQTVTPKVRKRTQGDHDAFLEAWNKSGFPKALKLTDARLKLLRARLNDPDWVAGWQEALTKLAKSDFARGGGNTGWVANVDWFLRPDSVTKILEGKYDSSENAEKKRDPGKANRTKEEYEQNVPDWMRVIGE